MKKSAKSLLALALVCAMTLGLFTGCGHECEFGKWKLEEEASCKEEGVEVRKCECGEEETRYIDKLEHTYEAAITTAATCLQEGVATYTCSVCQESYTEKLPKTDHTYEITEATGSLCGLGQQTTYTCTVCGNVHTDTVTAQEYSSTELPIMFQNSVGEVVIYDQSGQQLALGTCFVYSSDGKLITNYHVIESGYSAKVTLAGTTYDVTGVLAYDKNIDLAVLKIGTTGLEPVHICTETHLTGETVYAIGSSLGLTATFSNGMITQAERPMDGVTYIQHDAPISSGNSGGPLINKYGEVIGINTWTIRESQNLNFAIHTAELAKLDYSTPMTMAQFFQKESSPYNTLKNYILTYGTAGDGFSYVSLGTVTSSGTTFERFAYYFYDTNTLSFDCVVNNTYWTYFEIGESLNGVYNWYYFDDYDQEMEGTMYAASFNASSLLNYSNHNLSSNSVISSTLNLATAMIRVSVAYITQDLAALGITAKDLGFIYY